MQIPYFILWKWKHPTYRTTYSMSTVHTMVYMLTKHGVPLENIILVTDEPDGAPCRTFPLWTDHGQLQNISGSQLPSCYRRLRIFDPPTLQEMQIPLGSRVVSLDLDAVILQNFLHLFNRREKYVGWQVPGVRHRVVMNGSMFMFTAGELAWLWREFDPNSSPKAALMAGYMGSDQGYLSHRLCHQAFVGGWTSTQHGVLSFTRDVVKFRKLPRHGSIVFFAGRLKPWDAAVLKTHSWITRYTQAPKQEKVA